MRIVFTSLVLLTLFSVAGCNKISEKLNVKGNVAGRLLNADGSGRGYVSIALIDEAGAEVQRQTSEDSGNFFFSGVPGGKYTFRVEAGPGVELPSEPLTVNLGMGKTKQVQLKLKPEQAAPAQ